MDEKTGNYWRILETNLEWIRYSDAKATGILTIYGILITIAFTNILSIFELISQNAAFLILTALSGITSLIAIFYGFRSISPRIMPEAYASIIFFGSIVENHQNMEDFRKHTHEVLDSRVGLDDDLAKQIYINARIAAQKFRDVSISIRFFIFSMLSILAEMVIYFILKSV